jgi:hypothetical protein
VGKPTSIELEVIRPIANTQRIPTYVSRYTQTPGDSEPNSSQQSLPEDIQVQEAHRRLDEQIQLLRQLLTQQWESAEDQRRSSVSAPLQKTVALFMIFISIASLVAALWIGKIQIDLARPS